MAYKQYCLIHLKVASLAQEATDTTSKHHAKAANINSILESSPKQAVSYCFIFKKIKWF